MDNQKETGEKSIMLRPGPSIISIPKNQHYICQSKKNRPLYSQSLVTSLELVEAGLTSEFIINPYCKRF